MSDPGVSYSGADVAAVTAYKGGLGNWGPAAAGTGTYHPVMLPPIKDRTLNTLQDAKDWVTETTRILNEQRSELGMKTSLDFPFRTDNARGQDGTGHLIMIMSSEFAFNGGVNAQYPIKYEIFEECLKGLTNNFKAYADTKGAKPTICLALSAVVSYPVFNEAGKQMAENALFVTNNKVEGFQKISKHVASGVDGWDKSRYFDLRDTNPISVNSPERLRDHTHTIPEFDGSGGAVVIGMGTCKDSAFENYPGTHLLVFPGGGMQANIADKHQGGMLWNDTAHSHDQLNKGSGWFSFKPLVTFGEARIMSGLLEEYRAVLKQQGKTDEEISAALDVVGKDQKTDAMEDAILMERYDQILKSEGKSDAEIAAIKLNAGKAERNNKLAASNKGWPIAKSSRWEWTNKAEGKEVQLAFETALKAQGMKAEDVEKKLYLRPSEAEFRQVLEGTEYLWPSDLKQFVTWTRSSDNVHVGGDIRVGKPRKLPVKDLRHPTTAELLNMPQMHLFANQEEVNKAVVDAASAAADLGEPAPTKIVDIPDVMVKREAEAKEKGRPFSFSKWAKEICKFRAERRELPKALRGHDVEVQPPAPLHGGGLNGGAGGLNGGRGGGRGGEPDGNEGGHGHGGAFGGEGREPAPFEGGHGAEHHGAEHREGVEGRHG